MVFINIGAHFRYGSGRFQVYATYVENVRQDRYRGLGDMMTVLEDDRWVDGRCQVVRSRVRQPGY